MVTERFVLLPGIYNSGPTHWQTLWEASEPQRFSRFEPSDWDHPRRGDWIAALQSSVSRAGTPPVLVAHSLACLLVPMWAAGPHSPVAGAVLVAPADPASSQFPVDAHEFRDVPRDPLPFPALVVGSTDDQYATSEWSAAFATDLGASFVDAGALGHINADSGLGDWPQGKGLLREFSELIG